MLNTHHTPKFFLWLENILIPNYNLCKLLTFTQKNRRAFKYTHAQRLLLFKETNVFVFVSQKTKRPRFDSFEKKTEIQLNTKYIYVYIYIYIYMYVCMYVCMYVLGY